MDGAHTTTVTVEPIKIINSYIATKFKLPQFLATSRQWSQGGDE